MSTLVQWRKAPSHPSRQNSRSPFIEEVTRALGCRDIVIEFYELPTKDRNNGAGTKCMVALGQKMSEHTGKKGRFTRSQMRVLMKELASI